MCLFRKTCIFGLTILIVTAPFVASATEIVTTKEYVDGTRVQKPSTATAGQVLTYGTGATADSQPEAQYIKVPIATSDPSASSNPATPTGFASIWLQ